MLEHLYYTIMNYFLFANFGIKCYANVEQLSRCQLKIYFSRLLGKTFVSIIMYVQEFINDF